VSRRHVEGPSARKDSRPGVNVMILEKISAKKVANSWRFFTQNIAVNREKHYLNIGFLENRQFFVEKLVEMAENSAHYIEPCLK
jgi:hypothetical protein